MALDITGKIIQIMPATKGVSKAGKEWTKQEFVLETMDQFPRKVMMSVMGDKVSELSKYSVGNEVKASLNIESREWNGKWYTDVRAWKIEGSQGQAQQAAENFYPDTEPSFQADSSATDDLPF
jgi:hypothetical protein